MNARLKLSSAVFAEYHAVAATFVRTVGTFAAVGTEAVPQQEQSALVGPARKVGSSWRRIPSPALAVCPSSQQPGRPAGARWRQPPQRGRCPVFAGLVLGLVTTVDLNGFVVALAD